MPLCETVKLANGNGFGMTLGQASSLSGWPTQVGPAPHDTENTAGRLREDMTYSSPYAAKNYPLGTTSSGSLAETAKPGQLNPAFSRWLQGYPVAWCQAAIRVKRTLTPRRKREPGACAATVTPSSRKSRRK